MFLEADEQQTPSEKRIKTEELDSAITWQWEDDGHIWKPFSPSIMKEVEEAFKSEMKKAKIEINKIKFDIIFERMVQRNSKTFWERRIRVVSGQDENGDCETSMGIFLSSYEYYN